MKKPYLKKFGVFAGFKVWIVDGKYIRSNINEEFTNYAQHYRFKFIPKDEFWLDKEHGNDNEECYFIDNLLAQNRLMAKGMSYDKAVDEADRIEKRERDKHELLNKTHKNKFIEKIHKKLLKKYSNDKLKVWIINGRLVRDLFYIDFTEGGHDKVYKFVPANEIWLDDDLSLQEIKFVLLHEVHERNLMAKGRDYNSAHKSSSEIEYFCRKHPKQLDKKLNIEFKKTL